MKALFADSFYYLAVLNPGDQWHEEAQSFGYQPALAYQSKAQWLDKLNGQIVEFNGGYRPFISVITTHTTFISPEFQGSIARLSGPSLVVADEAHHLGAERRLYLI